MKAKDKKTICQAINNEGFDYALRHYSNWDEIKDDEFQQMLLEYLQLVERIEDYIDLKKYSE